MRTVVQKPKTAKPRANPSKPARAVFNHSLARRSLYPMPAESALADAAIESPSRFVYGFSRIPVHPAPLAIQSKPMTHSKGDTGGVNTSPPIVHEVLRSPGQPLDSATRSFFEPRFGHDLSQLRLHTDAKAGASARAIGAQAYTAGQNVVFAPGRFSPGTTAGNALLAHELAHAVQQRANATIPNGPLSISAPGDSHEREADRAASAVMLDTYTSSAMTMDHSPAVVARKPDTISQGTDADRREVVYEAARWLNSMASQLQAMRQSATLARETTVGSAAAPRAFHRILNQAILGRLMDNAISVFKAQRSDNPYINFPAESPEQTRLGEAYARAMEQFGLALEEARVNAANLAPAVHESEDALYATNHLKWLEANPAAPLAAGIRTTFTRAEVDMSARRHQQVTAELSNLTATVHQYNLAGDGAQRLRDALHNALYQLVRNPVSGQVEAQRDTALEASIQPILNQLDGIEWAVGQAVDRLQRAETLTRAFAADPAANQTVGNTLHSHFATRDPGYATLLADRFARMARELRGEGSLAIHARNPQDPDCGVGTVGSGFSVTEAHAKPNQFYFCGIVRIGDASIVSTVVHETVHAVIPSLGATGPVTATTETPRDRAYAGERIYSRLTTEEALDNAESYAFYVDQLLGVAVQRPSPPQDVITRCSDADTVRDAIARATYRIRLGAMWASQIYDQYHAALPQYVVTVVQEGFPDADVTRAREVLTHMRNLASRLEYYLPVRCQRAGDREARAGALAYGPHHAARAASVTSTTSPYAAGTLRLCPAWFQQNTAVREDSLTAILIFRYRHTVPVADVMGLVKLIRYIQEQAQPSLASRSLAQHQAADRPAPASP